MYYVGLGSKTFLILTQAKFITKSLYLDARNLYSDAELLPDLWGQVPLHQLVEQVAELLPQKPVTQPT